MIIHKNTKSVETSSLSPGKNFGHYENVFVVEDDSELGKKILANQLSFDLVLDEEGNLIDITPKERPPEPVPEQPETEILGQQLVEKDLQILELQQENQVLGHQIVDIDLRLLMGGM